MKAQAFDFINQLRTEPQAWLVCLPLATRQPRASEVVRLFALEIVNNAIQTRKIDPSGLLWIKDQIWQYLQGLYVSGAASQDPFTIENKLTQTVTCLFTSLYATQWTSLLDDLLSLMAKQPAMTGLNVDGTRFYLKTLASIHDEIADVMVSRSREEQQRDNDLKDLVRDRDVTKLTRSWQEILAHHKGGDGLVIEHCLAVIGRWASWTDLSLIIDDTLLNLMFELVSSGLTNRDAQSARLRDVALNTYMDVLGKKMKPPEKLQLIEAMNVRAVVAELAGSAPLQAKRFTSDYDTDLAELVGKMVNNTVDDIVNILESTSPQDPILLSANQQLKSFLPFTLRFFSDEYDEICSSVIPCLTNLLTFFRKRAGADSEYSTMLPSILLAIVQKMKYDETSEWGNENAETDEAEFAELRKRLQILQQAVAAVDETLYINTISDVVGASFANFQERKGQVDWRDIDLALHEMFLFGQLAIKNGGLYSKTKPVSMAAERLIAMMVKLVESNVADYSHPAIHLQYMEICVRYCTFFEANPSYIPLALDKFIRFVHHSHIKVKYRSWYLFHRFVKTLRAQFGNIAQSVFQAIGDILPIKAELPEETSDAEDISSNENVQSADSRFTSQLYLYEAIGNICSSPSVPVQTQVYYVQSVMSPLFSDLESQLQPAGAGDERALLQVHHLIMALGTLAHGFSEWMPGRVSSTNAPAKEVSLEFKKAAEAILVALEALNQSIEIRGAARAAFSRLVGVLGNEILQQLPRWIDGLLSRTSSKDEMATFLRLLDQVVFGFKNEIFGILNTLLTPFLRRVFDGIQEPTTGTDDEIQLSELKSQYLSFLLVILSNDLGRVFVTDGEILSLNLPTKMLTLKQRTSPSRLFRRSQRRAWFTQI